MSTFPSYARMLLDGTADAFEPSVKRTEMERGLPKQAVINSRVLRTLSVTLMFKTQSDVNAFEAWYFSEIGRIGWFDVTHPKTGQVHAMRFVGGDIGELVPLVGLFSIARRSVRLEYLQ